jgi:WD40 repeat protein
LSNIFISHSSRDNQAARAMQAWLEAKGHKGVFLDFDPALGIPVGVDWEQELYQRLRACRAVVALVSPAWLASPWCFFELRQARFLGKSVFPVRIEPCESGPILGDIQEGDLVTDPEAGHVQLWEGLRRAGLDPATMRHYDPARPPYPGLEALQEADAAVFFGRDDDTSAAMDTLASLRRVGGARLLLLLGASGSGKSSLLRAGLLPLLRRDPSSWLLVEPFRPGERPADELAQALVATGHRLGLDADPAALRSCVAGGDPAALAELCRELRQAAGCREGAALLVIDQAEELLGPAAEAMAFLRLLRGALAAGAGRLMAVATLRSDLLGSFQNHPLLEDLDYATRTIDPLPRRRLPEIIEGPAEVAGLAIGPGLVNALVDDAATADALPLLAFTLYEMHRQSRGGVLDLALYRSLGGLEGSVRRAADGLIQALDPDPAALATLRDVFVGSLVRSDEDGQIVRRRAFSDELPATAMPLLQRFVDARLLVAGRDAAGQETLEVAHEALLRTWPRLVAWLEEDRDRLRLREVFRRAAAGWDAHGREVDWLDHRGARLEAVEALVQERRFNPAAGAESDYLAACRARETEERGRAEAAALAERRRLEAEATAAAAGEAAARRVAARTRIAAAVTLVLALAASGAGVVAWRSAIEANAQREAAETALAARDLADSRRLALRAGQVLASGDDELALRLALAALPRAVASGAGPPDTVEAGEALARAVLGRHETTVLAGHTGAIRTAVFAPDGSSVLTAARDGTARLWDVAGAAGGDARPLVLAGHQAGLWSAVLSADGGAIATASDDGTIRLWDTKGGERRVLQGHVGAVLRVAMTPDGQTLLSTAADGTARLWRLATGESQMLGHDAMVWWADFDSSGRRALTTTAAGTASLWDAGTGESLHQLEGDPGGGGVPLARFAPDGSRVLTVMERDLAQLWDRDGRAIGRLSGLGDWLSAAAFSPDGRLVAIAGQDGAQVFETETARPVTAVRTGQDLIWDLAFSPDGAWLATAGNDGTARLFAAESGAPLLTLDAAAGKPLRAIAFSPDGTSLLTAGDDGIARLYRVRRFPTFETLLAFATGLDLEPLGPDEGALLATRQ